MDIKDRGKPSTANNRYSINDYKLELGMQTNGLSLSKNNEFQRDLQYYNKMFNKIKTELESNYFESKNVSNFDL
jgi:hypothetical protein